MKMKAAVKRATQAISDTLHPSDEDVAAVDILDTLKKEHDEVKDLLETLADAETPAQRRSLVLKIKKALVPHTKAEEKIVYDAVIALRDKSAQQDGHEGYLEHEWAAKDLAATGRYDGHSLPPSTRPPARCSKSWWSITSKKRNPMFGAT